MKTIKVKKYANRKLYIPKEGYVTIETIADIIKAGNTVEVIHNKTKEDVTNDVLKEVLTRAEMNNETLQGLIRG